MYTNDWQYFYNYNEYGWCKMKTKKIKLDNYEIRLVIKALNELRNESIKNQVPTDFIDEVLMKYITALEK